MCEFAGVITVYYLLQTCNVMYSQLNLATLNILCADTKR